MKKNLLSLAIVVALTVLSSSMAFAGGEADQAEGDGGYYIGLTVPTTQGGFMGALTSGLKDRFIAEGHKIEVGDSELNPARQIEIIENYIALGVDEIFVMAVDPSGLTDVLQKAMDSGIKIFAFTQMTEVYDKYAGSDDIASGIKIAEMAAEWIDKTYPDAAPGSIDIAIFENRDLPDMANRADGMLQITSMTDKVNIVATVGVDGTPVTAQSRAENLFMTNPGIKAVLCYNTDTASGVSAYATALNSQIEDPSGFAVFACDFSELAAQLLQASKTDDSVVRGVVRMGTTFQAIIDDGYRYAMEPLTEVDYDPISYAELYKITADNMEDMIQ
jgi:ribose transport system substrate-binding protein